MNADNPRAVIGGNNPPPESAIERAAEPIEALRVFLAANPVITTEDESREAKSVFDAATTALKAVEAERKGKVDPLNEEVKRINGEYHKLHNGDAKRPGTWDKLLSELKSKMTAYAIMEERKRFEAEQEARRIAEEAAEAARRAAEAEAEARAAVEAGECDVDLAGAIEAADTTSQRALRAMWTANRAEAQSKVRVVGGSRNAISLKDHETLTVTDWKAAIEALSDEDGNIPQAIADEIIKCARGYRKTFKHLPAGIEASYERSL